MKPPEPAPRILALLLALGLPGPAFALRPLNAGMEESPVRDALEAELTAGMEEVTYGVPTTERDLNDLIAVRTQTYLASLAPDMLEELPTNPLVSPLGKLFLDYLKEAKTPDGVVLNPQQQEEKEKFKAAALLTARDPSRGILGYVYAQSTRVFEGYPPFISIAEIGVRKDRQRQGIGTALMRKVLQGLVNAYPRANVIMRDASEDGKTGRIAEQFGFVPMEERPSEGSPELPPPLYRLSWNSDTRQDLKRRLADAPVDLPPVVPVRRRSQAAGLEESITDWVRQEDREDLREFLKLPVGPGSFEPDSNWAQGLVQGAKGEWWIHFHSFSRGARPGFLAKLVPGDTLGIGVILMEPSTDDLATFVRLDTIPGSEAEQMSAVIKDYFRPHLPRLKQMVDGINSGENPGYYTRWFEHSVLAQSVTEGEEGLFVIAEPSELDAKGELRLRWAGRSSGKEITYQRVDKLAAELEEREAAREELRGILAGLKSNILDIRLLQDALDQGVDLSSYVSRIGELLSKAGYAQGIARYVPLSRMPGAELAEGVSVFVQEEYEGQVRQQLSGVPGVTFFRDSAAASIVIGNKNVPIKPGQILLQVNSPEDAGLVTGRLLAYLQNQGLLQPGAIIAINSVNADDLSQDVVIFA